MRLPVRAVATAGLLACSPGSDRPPSTLVIASSTDVGTLMGVVAQTRADLDVVGAIDFPLVEADFDCGLRFQPALAERWAWSEGGRVLSMWLRDDIRFADGQAVDAVDVAFTYQLMADPEVASPGASKVARMQEDGRPRVLGDHHLEWHFDEAYSRDTQLLHASGLGLVPEHVLGAADRASLRSHPYGGAPLASGPWRVAVHQPGERVVLEPNPEFTGPERYRPRLDRVVFRILPDPPTRLLELQTGGVDLVAGLTVAEADRVRRESPGIRLARRGWRTMDYVGWNLRRPPFEDARLRRALALAVDVDDLIERLLTSESGEAYGRRAVGTLTPMLCGIDSTGITPLPFDPAASRALLAEAGWTDTDGDGVVDRDGQPLAFSLLTNTGNSRRADTAVLIQAQLRAVGVEVRIEKNDGNRFVERLRTGDFDAALAGWAAELVVDPSPRWRCDQPERPAPYNFVGYCSDEVDALIERGLATTDPEQAAPIWSAFQERVYRDQPYLFLFWMDEIVAVHERFEDTRIDALSPIHRLHEWTVRPEE